MTNINMPPGVRFRSGKIEIKWWLRGTTYSETLDLPQTAFGVAEAAAVRIDRRRRTKMNGAWRDNMAPTGEHESLNSAYSGAFKRARRRREYTLTLEQENSLVEACDGRCSITGILFSADKYGASKAPYAPSLDRIDSTKPYTLENVRLVCTAANFAMNEWGESVLEAVAKGYIKNTVL